MKKIVLHESQVSNLIDKIVSEQFTADNRYSQEVKCSFGYHNLKYLDDEIDWISDVKFKVYFTIDREEREYGIKSIAVGNVIGPKEIQVEVTVYPEGSDDTETYSSITLRPQWYNVVKIEKDADIGWIGIDDEIQMELTNIDGRLEVAQIIVHSREV